MLAETITLVHALHKHFRFQVDSLNKAKDAAKGTHTNFCKHTSIHIDPSLPVSPDISHLLFLTGSWGLLKRLGPGDSIATKHTLSQTHIGTQKCFLLPPSCVFYFFPFLYLPNFYFYVSLPFSQTHTCSVRTRSTHTGTLTRQALRLRRQQPVAIVEDSLSEELA